VSDDAPSRPMPLEERRAGDVPATRDDINQIKRELAAGGLRMTAIERELQMNTSVTADVRALLDAARVGLKVLGALGTAVTWAAKIAGAAVAIWGAWQAIKHGGAPK
jgi:hypothetical protein